MRKNLSIRVAIATITALATVGCSIPAFAWGPERQTYTNDVPADHVTFNSITNNVAMGDERNFVRVRALDSNDNYTDVLNVEPGKEYSVYIFYHNNAASNLNSSGKGIANGVKVASAYPVEVKKGEKGMVSGIITATDSDPTSVWDEAYFTTNYDNVYLRYKPGTAIIHNSGDVNNSVLSTNLFTEDGTYIGINTLDGRIPGCAEYSGYITYTLVAEQENTPTDCTTNPELPECQQPNCATNPEMEGCQELPNTGPVEVILAIVIVLGIAGGGYYLYRTKKTLKTAEKVVKGEDTKGLESTPEMPSKKTEEPKEAKK